MKPSFLESARPEGKHYVGVGRAVLRLELVGRTLWIDRRVQKVWSEDRLFVSADACSELLLAEIKAKIDGLRR